MEDTPASSVDHDPSPNGDKTGGVINKKHMEIESSVEPTDGNGPPLLCSHTPRKSYIKDRADTDTSAIVAESENVHIRNGEDVSNNKRRISERERKLLGLDLQHHNYQQNMKLINETSPSKPSCSTAHSDTVKAHSQSDHTDRAAAYHDDIEIHTDSESGGSDHLANRTVKYKEMTAGTENVLIVACTTANRMLRKVPCRKKGSCIGRINKMKTKRLLWKRGRALSRAKAAKIRFRFKTQQKQTDDSEWESVTDTEASNGVQDQQAGESSVISHMEGEESQAADGQLQIVEELDEHQIPLKQQLEKNIEEVCAKNNLSASNAKNIIRSLVTNTLVKDMLKSSLQGPNEEPPEGQVVYEPKLTRARVKKVLEKEKDPQLWPVSPIKLGQPASTGPSILDVEFSDEEDDEYHPSKDLEDAESDDESYTSTPRSETGSPFPFGSSPFGRPPTPATPTVPASVSVVPTHVPLSSPAPAIPAPGPSNSSEIQPEIAKNPMGPPLAPPPNAHSTKKRLTFAPPTETPQETETDLQVSDETSLPVKNNEHDDTQKEEEDGIARRTRSKLPLTTTSIHDIEEAFVAPDITPDMYDTMCDDTEWQKFLKSLHRTEGADTQNESMEVAEEDDPEFNYIAEAEQEENEPEEDLFQGSFRVSRKELNTLIEELEDLFNEDFSVVGAHTKIPPVNENISKKTSVTTSISKKLKAKSARPNYLWRHLQRRKRPSMPKVTVPTTVPSVQTETMPFAPVEIASDDPVAPVMLNCQMRQLQQQMRQHIQLATQMYILTQCSPDHYQLADGCKKMLKELQMMGALSRAGPQSFYSAYNLAAAVEIIDREISWESYRQLVMSSPTISESASGPFQTTQLTSEQPATQSTSGGREDNREGADSAADHQIDSSKKSSRVSDIKYYENRRNLLNIQKELMWRSPAFLYPSFLPTRRLLSDGRKIHGFSKWEDALLALGIEQFKSWDKDICFHMISQYMMPGRSYTSLRDRFKNANRVSKKEDSFIWKYKMKNELPVTPRDYEDFSPDMVKAPCERPLSVLPGWCKGCHRYDKSQKRRQQIEENYQKRLAEMANKKIQKKLEQYGYQEGLTEDEWTQQSSEEGMCTSHHGRKRRMEFGLGNRVEELDDEGDAVDDEPDVPPSKRYKRGKDDAVERDVVSGDDFMNPSSAPFSIMPASASPTDNPAAIVTTMGVYVPIHLADPARISSVFQDSQSAQVHQTEQEADVSETGDIGADMPVHTESLQALQSSLHAVTCSVSSSGLQQGITSQYTDLFDRSENQGRELLDRSENQGRELLDRSENQGRELLDRPENQGRELLDRSENQGRELFDGSGDQGRELFHESIIGSASVDHLAHTLVQSSRAVPENRQQFCDTPPRQMAALYNECLNQVLFQSSGTYESGENGRNFSEQMSLSTETNIRSGEERENQPSQMSSVNDVVATTQHCTAVADVSHPSSEMFQNLSQTLVIHNNSNKQTVTPHYELHHVPDNSQKEDVITNISVLENQYSVQKTKDTHPEPLCQQNCACISPDEQKEYSQTGIVRSSAENAAHINREETSVQETQQEDVQCCGIEAREQVSAKSDSSQLHGDVIHGEINPREVLLEDTSEIRDGRIPTDLSGERPGRSDAEHNSNDNNSQRDESVGSHCDPGSDVSDGEMELQEQEQVIDTSYVSQTQHPSGPEMEQTQHPGRPEMEHTHPSGPEMEQNSGENRTPTPERNSANNEIVPLLSCSPNPIGSHGRADSCNVYQLNVTCNGQVVPGSSTAGENNVLNLRDNPSIQINIVNTAGNGGSGNSVTDSQCVGSDRNNGEVVLNSGSANFPLVTLSGVSNSRRSTSSVVNITLNITCSQGQVQVKVSSSEGSSEMPSSTVTGSERGEHIQDPRPVLADESVSSTSDIGDSTDEKSAQDVSAPQSQSSQTGPADQQLHGSESQPDTRHSVVTGNISSQSQIHSDTVMDSASVRCLTVPSGQCEHLDCEETVESEHDSSDISIKTSSSAGMSGSADSIVQEMQAHHTGPVSNDSKGICRSQELHRDQLIPSTWINTEDITSQSQQPLHREERSSSTAQEMVDQHTCKQSSSRSELSALNDRGPQVPDIHHPQAHALPHGEDDSEKSGLSGNNFSTEPISHSHIYSRQLSLSTASQSVSTSVNSYSVSLACNAGADTLLQESVCVEPTINSSSGTGNCSFHTPHFVSAAVTCADNVLGSFLIDTNVPVVSAGSGAGTVTTTACPAPRPTPVRHSCWSGLSSVFSSSEVTEVCINRSLDEESCDSVSSETETAEDLSSDHERTAQVPDQMDVEVCETGADLCLKHSSVEIQTNVGTCTSDGVVTSGVGQSQPGGSVMNPVTLGTELGSVLTSSHSSSTAGETASQIQTLVPPVTLPQSGASTGITCVDPRVTVSTGEETGSDRSPDKGGDSTSSDPLQYSPDHAGNPGGTHELGTESPVSGQQQLTFPEDGTNIRGTPDIVEDDDESSLLPSIRSPFKSMQQISFAGMLKNSQRGVEDGSAGGLGTSPPCSLGDSGASQSQMVTMPLMSDDTMNALFDQMREEGTLANASITFGFLNNSNMSTDILSKALKAAEIRPDDNEGGSPSRTLGAAPADDNEGDSPSRTRGTVQADDNEGGSPSRTRGTVQTNDSEGGCPSGTHEAVQTDGAVTDTPVLPTDSACGSHSVQHTQSDTVQHTQYDTSHSVHHTHSDTSQHTQSDTSHSQWTREQDRVILEMVRDHGDSVDTYTQIAATLSCVTPQQVSDRVSTLLDLLGSSEDETADSVDEEDL